MQSQYVHPSQLTAEQRTAAMADVNTRFANAFARVAADTTQSKTTRAAARRDLAGAQRIARALEA